ncbi:MAG: hypothetical protein KGZ79_05830 [Dethiobacter sp.]|jgi:hypothetical protein|nr:hypothetical protein [Dethiobacter sp.]
MNNIKAKEDAAYTVDAAVAKPVNSGLVDPSILGVGMVSGTAAVKLGQGVQKSGRSTAVTSGRVTLIGASVKVGFSSGRSALFTGQIVTTRMGASGDSGSLLVDGAKRAVGLLFAGSSGATLYNPITTVLESLNVDLGIDSRTDDEKQDEYLVDLRRLCRDKTPAILALPNVVGVGIGLKRKDGVKTGVISLVALVEKKVAANMLREDEIIPRFVEDIPTDVLESGEFSAIARHTWYGRPLNRKIKTRPARPGLSIGHYRVSAGTFGAVVFDRDSGEPLILSNNHVLANSTNGEDGMSEPGDPILQPGKQDGGSNPHDMLGTLLRFTPIRFL